MIKEYFLLDLNDPNDVPTNEMKAKILKALLMALGVNAALFAVFFFDLDGKLLFYVVEPTLKKHYDNMPRRDMTKMPYEMNKPNYEYNV